MTRARIILFIHFVTVSSRVSRQKQGLSESYTLNFWTNQSATFCLCGTLRCP